MAYLEDCTRTRLCYLLVMMVMSFQPVADLGHAETGFGAENGRLPANDRAGWCRRGRARRRRNRPVMCHVALDEICGHGRSGRWALPKEDEYSRPAASALMSESSPAITEAQTIRASCRAFSPGVSGCGPAMPSICSIAFCGERMVPPPMVPCQPLPQFHSTQKCREHSQLRSRAWCK